MFQRIRFHPELRVVHLDWLEPNRNETLESYCFRFGKLIDTSQPFSVVGLSFGGMIANELTRFLNPQHLILLSSLSSKRGLPSGYRLAGWLRLHKVIPAFILKTPSPITSWFFGVKEAEEKILLTQILQDTSSQFLQWAIEKALTWQRSDCPMNKFHIHGTNDHILPHEISGADLLIEGAGHLMVYTHAEQVSRSINQKLGFI